MFNIRQVTKIDVYVIPNSDVPAGTHTVDSDLVMELDELLGAGRGVLKIPTTPGHFCRYPVHAITGVADYCENDYSGASVELYQGLGGLYLVDPETGAAWALKFASTEAGSFAEDGFNLSEGNVTIDQLGDRTAGNAREAGATHLHIATNRFSNGHIAAGPGVLQASVPAITYLGDKVARALALDVPIPQRRRA